MPGTGSGRNGREPGQELEFINLEDAPLLSEILDLNPFQNGAGEYDRWYDDHPGIFAGEVEAVEILKAEGFRAVRMEEGVQEWQHLGLGAGEQAAGECSK